MEKFERSRQMKKLTYLLAALLIVFLLIQLIPVNRDNPEFDVEYELEAPVEVKEIIVNSCFDCHSSQTDWPWYSYVAPVSWFVTNHVNEGRQKINFSEWLKQPEEKRQKIKDEMIEEILEGEMPLPIYLVMHPVSELSQQQKQAVKKWTAGIKID
jgi:hypothetical protein